MVNHSEDLNDPATRRRLLARMRPETAHAHHELLRDLLAREVEYRRRDPDDDGDFFENLYWVGFLLHCVGDPTDALDLYRAKHTNFDTACGMDIQTIFGAGAERTLAYLRATGNTEIADQLSTYPELHDDLYRWVAWKRDYFYG